MVKVEITLGEDNKLEINSNISALSTARLLSETSANIIENYQQEEKDSAETEQE